MNIGMLWFDNSKRPLEDRLKRAATYYQNKYGQVANIAAVPPGEIQGETADIAGMKATANKAIRANHLWIGHEERTGT